MVGQFEHGKYLLWMLQETDAAQLIVSYNVELCVRMLTMNRVNLVVLVCCNDVAWVEGSHEFVYYLRAFCHKEPFALPCFLLLKLSYGFQ